MSNFTDINQFRHLVKAIHDKARFVGLDSAGDPIYNGEVTLPTLKLIGTTKLHGTCAAISWQNGTLSCHSKNNKLTPENDNYGFAKFVYSLPDNVKSDLGKLVNNNGTLFFEWAGKGIQSNVAIAQKDKFLTLFAAKNEHDNWIDTEHFVTPNEYNIFNVFQFAKFEIEINFNDPIDLANKTNQMNDITLQVEKECPAGKFFNVSGIGEGVVWKVNHPDYNNSKFWYKNKGSEHSKSHVKKTATVDVEKVKSATEYATKHTHNGRLEQAFNWLKESGKPQNEKSTGDFIRWIINDIEKEEKDEREASNLSDSDVKGPISTIAKNWFFKKIV
jgi:RNA ligase